jgi:hypothetical protein
MELEIRITRAIGHRVDCGPREERRGQEDAPDRDNGRMEQRRPDARSGSRAKDVL